MAYALSRPDGLGGATCACCPDVDTLTVTISDLLSCGCLDGGAIQTRKLVISGINGVFMLSRVGDEFRWILETGSWEFHGYTADELSDPPCDPLFENPDSPQTGKFIIQVGCLDGAFSMIISGSPNIPILTNDIFEADIRLGESADNLVICGNLFFGAGGGRATVEL